MNVLCFFLRFRDRVKFDRFLPFPFTSTWSVECSTPTTCDSIGSTIHLIPFFGSTNPRWKHRIHHRCRSSIFLLFIVRFYFFSHSPFAWCSFSRRHRWFLCFYPRFHCFIHPNVSSLSLHSFHYYLLLEQIVSVAFHPSTLLQRCEWVRTTSNDKRQTIRTHYEIFDSFRWKWISCNPHPLICPILLVSSTHSMYSIAPINQIFTYIYALETYLFQFEFGQRELVCWWRGGRTQNYYYKPLTSITHTLIFG